MRSARTQSSIRSERAYVAFAWIARALEATVEKKSLQRALQWANSMTLQELQSPNYPTLTKFQNINLPVAVLIL